MSEYAITEVSASDKRTMNEVVELLNAEGIRLDPNVDYTCAMLDEDYNVIATGSCFKNTLRCMAVSSAHQGEGLMNDIVTHLVNYQYGRGNYDLFLYTKTQSSKFFSGLGFTEIARIEGQVSFMENRRTGFADYLKKLAADSTKKGISGAIVMNANPFSLGHLYLVEKAAAECNLLHLFIVSEDASYFPADVRKRLVMEGTAHIPNIRYHDTGQYIISQATFPSYFQKNEDAVIESHARLDIDVFVRIAETMHITRRYVGEEPASLVTGIYNTIMTEELPKHGIECVVVPRKTSDDQIISASTIREAIRTGDEETLEKMCPPATLAYLHSDESVPVIQRIRSEKNVRHY